jgi:hypothetical protein
VITAMGKLQLTGRNLGRVFNSRRGRVHATKLPCFGTKLPDLKLKTQARLLSGPLPLDIVLPVTALKAAGQLEKKGGGRGNKHGIFLPRHLSLSLKIF